MTTNTAADILSTIHRKLAEDMLALLEDGGATAKDWAVIVKFLKDNGIDGISNDPGDAASAFGELVKRAQASIESQYPQ